MEIAPLIGRSSGGVSTTTPPPEGRLRRPRPRRGFDPRFWGKAAAPPVEASYWRVTRRPIPCLLFVLPLLAAYEIGVSWIGGSSAEALRTGADAWVRQALARLHLTDRWLPPMALVLALLGWQAFRGDPWKFRPRCLLGMAAESLALAVALIGLSRLVDLGFDRLEGHDLLRSGGPANSAILGFVGAGVYEEAIFRLVLIPGLYFAARAIAAPKLASTTLAVTGSALLFSLAHHAGAPGEPFTLFAFLFRWLAGIYFAWVFVVRGFGVAVGTHAAYDILVGWAGVHF